MDFANPTSSRRQESPLVDDLLDDNQADSDIVTEDSGLSKTGNVNCLKYLNLTLIGMSYASKKSAHL